jgi:hypothetical protein
MGYVMAVSGPVGMDVGGTFQRFMETLGRIVPRLIVFVVILVIGWLIAKIIERAATMILERLHFNRVAERGVVGDALRRSDYDASRLIARLLFYAVMLIALQVAFNVFGPNPISDLLRAIVAWLPRLAVAIIIVVVASAIAHAVRDIVGAALGAMAYGQPVGDLHRRAGHHRGAQPDRHRHDRHRALAHHGPGDHRRDHRHRCRRRPGEAHATALGAHTVRG